MKKSYRILIICIAYMFTQPVNGMFTRAASRVKPRAPRTFKTPQTYIQQKALYTVPNVSSAASTSWFANKALSFKNQITQLVTDVPRKMQSDVEIESESIINQLHSKNPWGNSFEEAKKSPLAERIEKFLKKNKVDDIKNVFASLIKTKSGSLILNYMIQKDDTLASKLIPLVEVFFDTIRFKLMVTFLSSELSSVDPSKIESLKQRFFEREDTKGDFFTTWARFDSALFFKLLPNNAEALINIIKQFCTDVDRNPFVSTATFERPFDINAKIIQIGGYYFNEVNNFVFFEELSRVIVEKLISIKDLKQLFIRLSSSDYGKVIVNNLPLMNDKEYRKYLSQSRDGINRLATSLPPADFIEAILDIDSSYEQIPSYHHLLKFGKELNISNLLHIQKNPYFKDMIHKAMDKEKESIGQYEVFYHARRWQYGFLSDIYSMLYSYKSGKDLKDFIFTHLDDPVLGNVSEKFSASEKQKRERLVEEGNPFSTDTKSNPFGLANRQTLLFLNKFLFGNISNPGSSSIDYVINNHNVGNIDFSVKEIFIMFGYSNIYQQYESELLELQDEYNRLSEYGELLQILIPKETVNESVYYTTSGGPKKEMEISSGSTTSDIKEILRDLDEDPKDRVEFVMINTRDKFGGLNPDSGIKVFSYNTVDPAKMAVFKEKENNLFARIQKSLKQKQLQENRKQLATE